jgi:hypothetical protein
MTACTIVYSALEKYGGKRVYHNQENHLTLMDRKIVSVTM